MSLLVKSLEEKRATAVAERDQALRERDELLEGIEAHRKAVVAASQPLNTTAQIRADRDLHVLADRIKNKGASQ